MSEHSHHPKTHHEAHRTPEHHNTLHESSGEHTRHHEAENKPEAQAEYVGHDELDSIKRSIEQHAITSAETASKHTEDEQPQSHRPLYVNKELKSIAYQRTMLRVRKQMSVLDKGLSHVVHNPVVDKASDVAGATVGRPSGLLGAGLVTFIGTTAYFWIAKHFGYEYNFGAFIVLLIIGFGGGILFELVGRLRRKV